MKTLKTRLKEGVSNFYLFEGEDYYLYDRGFGMIKKAISFSMPDFNLAIFDDDNYSMKAVLDSCDIMPLGDERRIVLMKNVTKVTENDKKALEAYLKNPSKTTILVIFDYPNKLSSLKEYGFVDCKRFDSKTATGVIVNELAKRNKQISGEAVATLLDYCNGYLSRAINELDKLVYFNIDDPLVTKKIVDTLVTKDAEYVVFELTEALGQRNGDKALKLLNEMKREQGLVGLITNHFRRLFFISTSDLDDKTLSQMLGVKEYAVSKQRMQAKNFSKMQLKKIYSLLEDVDYNIKSGQMSQENSLFYLVISILNI